MSNRIRIFLTIVMLSAMMGCKKKNLVPPTPEPPKEENIAFTIDPDPGTGVANSLSETYSFKVTVSSKLTTSGIKFELTTKKDADNSTIDSKSLDSTTPAVNLSTGSLNPGVLCTVTVTVTSKTTATNTATKSFKVARK